MRFSAVSRLERAAALQLRWAKRAWLTCESVASQRARSKFPVWLFLPSLEADDRMTLRRKLTSSPRHAAGGFPEVIRDGSRFIGCCPAQRSHAGSYAPSTRRRGCPAARKILPRLHV